MRRSWQSRRGWSKQRIKETSLKARSGDSGEDRATAKVSKAQELHLSERLPKSTFAYGATMAPFLRVHQARAKLASEFSIQRCPPSSVRRRLRPLRYKRRSGCSRWAWRGGPHYGRLCGSLGHGDGGASLLGICGLLEFVAGRLSGSLIFRRRNRSRLVFVGRLDFSRRLSFGRLGTVGDHGRLGVRGCFARLRTAHLPFSQPARPKDHQQGNHDPDAHFGHRGQLSMGFRQRRLSASRRRQPTAATPSSGGTPCGLNCWLREAALGGTSSPLPLLLSRRAVLLCHYALRASAPPMISISSVVIAAWRARLYCKVRAEIMSLAFLVAESIAVIRAPSSEAIDS